jgi:predicted MFS family arabinose efflux permease
MTTVVPGYRAVLRVPGLRAMYLAHAVSMAGTITAEVALSISMFQRTGSALLSALVLACSFLPYAVGGTVLSSIADRFPARRVLVCCDLVGAVCVAAMLLPGVPVPVVLGLLAVVGLVAPVFQGARAASLAHLLDEDTFAAGRSLLRTISQTTVLVGFAAGGALVAAIGLSWLLVANVASFLVSAAVIGLATPYSPANSSGPAPRGGLRYVFGTARLRRLLFLSWSAPLFSCVHTGLAVAYTVQTGASATAAGAIFACYAAGTILGELVVTRLAPPTRRRLVVPLVLASQLPAVVYVTVPALPVAAALAAVAGAGFAFNQGLDPRIVTATEPAFLGRVFTVQSSGLMSVQGVGIGVAGAAASVLAPSLVICLAGVLGTVLTLRLAKVALG